MKYSTPHKLHKLIKFRSFYLAQHIIAKYVDWFNQEEYREALYSGTPRTKEDVRAWIAACIEDPQREYFFVYASGELIGHIGLRGINQKLKHAEVGSFFPHKRQRQGEVMEKGLLFLISKATKLGIKLLTADFVLTDSPHLKPFLKVGFTRTPFAPHYLTLHLN